jgi:PTS system cellobiose-specific IIB component
MLKKEVRKVIKIVLVCHHGASTSMLTEKIAEAAKNKGIDADVNAYSITEIAKIIDSVDIILLGPQVRSHLSRLQKEYAGKGVSFITIEPTDYGRLNGENILATVLAALGKNKEEKNV